jgi:hypothetical protein
LNNTETKVKWKKSRQADRRVLKRCAQFPHCSLQVNAVTNLEVISYETISQSENTLHVPHSSESNKVFNAARNSVMVACKQSIIGPNETECSSAARNSVMVACKQMLSKLNYETPGLTFLTTERTLSQSLKKKPSASLTLPNYLHLLSSRQPLAL